MSRKDEKSRVVNVNIEKDKKAQKSAKAQYLIRSIDIFNHKISILNLI